MSYSGIFPVMKDLSLYLARQASVPFTLNLVQQLAVGRWSWFCDQWEPIFKKQIFTFAAGDEELIALAKRLQKDVQTYKLGAKSFNPFSSTLRFGEYGPLLSSISTSVLGLSLDEQIIVNNEQQRVSKFTIDTFLQMRHAVRKEVTVVTQEVGLGDSDASKTMDLPVVAAQRIARTEDYYQIESGLGVEDLLDQVIYDLKNRLVSKDPDLLRAANSNIDSASRVSIQEGWKTYVGVPFYQSLEEMARRYLGSADKWFELVTVNNLQAPYYDDVGTKYPLTSPGAGSAVRISNTALTNVRVGARVKVGSVTKQAQMRNVDRVVENGDNTVTLYLSGEPNLNTLRTTESAYVRAYAPDTVNSDSFLKIPLNVASGTPALPAPQADVLKRLDNALRAFGVDALRNETTGDFSISGGDFALAYGLTNVRQAILSVLRTGPGELPYHSNFGIPTEPGDVWGGTINEGVIIAEIIQESIRSSGRYEFVIVRDIQTTGSSISINMLVGVPGSSTVIPLSFVGQ